MGLFDGLETALASFLGTDTATAGFILGVVTIVALFIALAWALGDHVKGPYIMLPVGIGIVFVTLIGWWPPWALIFLIVIGVIAWSMRGDVTAPM